jgi:predicted MPP superfamily phosphohydrolase
LNKKTCDLQLSGHTGGGYIYLPFIGSLIKDKNGKLYSHGTYKEKNATLIVSNGISPKSSFPYKLNTKNEVNLITLKKSA